MKALPSVSYPTDFTDREWALLKPLLLPAIFGGRPRSVNLHVVREWTVLRAAQWLPAAIQALVHAVPAGAPCPSTTSGL